MFFRGIFMKYVALRRTVGLVLTVFIMVFIFSMSSQNAEISKQTSGGVIHFVAGLLYPDFHNLGQQAQDQIISAFQGIVRSAAHFSVFAALCFSSLIFTLTLERLNLLMRYCSSIIFSILYAVSDEIHQLFIPGRAFQFSDILVDTLGILLGAAVMYLIIKLKKRTQS